MRSCSGTKFVMYRFYRKRANVAACLPFRVLKAANAEPQAGRQNMCRPDWAMSGLRRGRSIYRKLSGHRSHDADGRRIDRDLRNRQVAIPRIVPVVVAARLGAEEPGAAVSGVPVRTAPAAIVTPEVAAGA